MARQPATHPLRGWNGPIGSNHNVGSAGRASNGRADPRGAIRAVHGLGSRPRPRRRRLPGLRLAGRGPLVGRARAPGHGPGGHRRLLTSAGVPELPEITALAERIADQVAGRPFAGAVPLSFSGLKTVVPPPESLVGATVEAVGRRGKFLIFEFGGPRLLIHLSQGGRVDIESPPKTTKPKGAVVRFEFRDRPSVLLKEFGTERKAGWWVLRADDDGPLAKLGPDPYSDEFETFVLDGTDT